MPRFSANISMMFTEHALLDRFAIAKKSGFGAVEMQFPYDFSPEELLAAKLDADVEITVINIGAGDLGAGPGIAAVPGAEEQFKAAVAQAVTYAEKLKPLNMNVLPGWPPMERYSRQDCLDVLAGNLHCAAEALASTGTKVLVEAVNTYDRPGFLLYTSAQALEVVRAANHENLAIEYDLYHMQIMEGNLIKRMTEILDHIGHIQFADTPGRNEPGTGEINYPNIFAAIDEMGWQGWLGAEYIPSGLTEGSLDWLQPYL